VLTDEKVEKMGNSTSVGASIFSTYAPDRGKENEAQADPDAAFLGEFVRKG
jgi:hypothetical protein